MSKKSIKIEHQSIHRKHDTFIVKINHSQDDTWHGEVVWADENKSVKFRSTLELLRLIDEAVKSGKSIGEVGGDHLVI
jgi:hypothetical protein